MKTAGIAIRILLIMTFLTGIIYPVTMTGISQLIFPSKAKGSLVYRNNTVIGSELIGQKFDSSIYFWSRPSENDFNPMPSSGSNLGPSSLKLNQLVNQRKAIWIKASNQPVNGRIPVEMIFASGSGLDPHISPASAFYQAGRVAGARAFTRNQKEMMFEIIKRLSEKPQYLFLGEPRINVFELNLAIDTIR